MVFSQKQVLFNDLTLVHFVYSPLVREAQSHYPKSRPYQSFWGLEGGVGDEIKLSSAFTMGTGKGAWSSQASTPEKELAGKSAF